MIYCFGDSFTYGDELQDRSDAWPGVLDQLTDHTVINYGQPGASNSWICNKVVQKCLEQKPQVAIIAWTTTDRYEFFGENNTSRCFNINQSDRLPFVQQLYSEYHNSTGKFIEWISQAILIQNFLENQKINYLFANAFGIDDILVENKNNDYFQKMLSYLNTEYFVGWPNENFIDWSRGSPLGPKGHFLEQGHQQVAEKIYNQLNNIT
jgi:lysophospholipase L1-like esterase